MSQPRGDRLIAQRNKSDPAPGGVGLAMREEAAEHRSQARRGPLRAFQESHMQRLQTTQYKAWRCRREQYLRESGRHVDLIREGFASPDDATNWTVVVGGRGRGPLQR